MYYQVSQEFFEKLPNACFGAVAVRGLDNTHDIPQLEQMLAENVAACETYFAGKKPKETEDILPYRAAFTALGINPNKFLCSIEALLTRIAKGKGFPHINAAVDLGNAVSIKHRLPMGAHDLDQVVPVFIMLLAMPISGSIGHGIGLAMIAYTVIKVFSGRAKDVSVLTYVIAALFLVKFFAVV